MRRLLGAAALALSLGCLDGGTEPVSFWVPSSYRLEAVDGAALPVTLTTGGGSQVVLEHDSLALRQNLTFFHERRVSDASGARTVADSGNFAVTRDVEIVIAGPADGMLLGAGYPMEPVSGIATVIEFQTNSTAAYGAHRYRYVRTAP